MTPLRYLLTLFLTLNLAFGIPGDLQKSIEKSVQNYNLAKNSYLKTGPEGFLKYADFLNRQDRLYLKAQLSKLPQLPDLEVGENSFKIKYQDNSFKIEVFYEDSIILGLPNGHKISMTPKRSLETISNEIQKSLEISKSHYEIIPSANAEMSVMMGFILGLVGGFAGYWIYNSFFAAKPSTNSGQVHKITVTDLPHASPTGGGGGEAAGTPSNTNNSNPPNNPNANQQGNGAAGNPGSNPPQQANGAQSNPPQGGANPSNGQPPQANNPQGAKVQLNNEQRKQKMELAQIFCTKINNNDNPNVVFTDILNPPDSNNVGISLGRILSDKFKTLKDAQPNSPDDKKKQLLLLLYSKHLGLHIQNNNVENTQVEETDRKIAKILDGNAIKLSFLNNGSSGLSLSCELNQQHPPVCDSKNIKINFPGNLTKPLCSFPPPKNGASTQQAPTPPQGPNGPAPNTAPPAPTGAKPTSSTPDPIPENPD
ncbi:MAG: hypothetical protein KA116_06635 [Proteobacteria bacterium]|nr:hypothetical protein [Pseudomonadota bacterium]